MKRILIVLTGIILISGCATTYNYLPEMDELSSSPYGSYISVRTAEYGSFKGELLAVEGDTLVIGDLNKPQYQKVDSKLVNYSFIQFGKYKTFVLAPVISISHGLWMIFTVPINAIVALSLSTADRVESRFYNPDLKTVYVYARYPQGLPEGFSEAVYKPAKFKE